MRSLSLSFCWDDGTSRLGAVLLPFRRRKTIAVLEAPLWRDGYPLVGFNHLSGMSGVSGGDQIVCIHPLHCKVSTTKKQNLFGMLLPKKIHPGLFTNRCHETVKMGVPARHRERSGEAGGPPGNRPTVPRGWFRGVPVRYVAGSNTRGRQEGRHMIRARCAPLSPASGFPVSWS